MQKNGLYIAFDDFNFDSSADVSGLSGIQKKIYFQINTFKKYGYNVDFINPYLTRKHSIERIFRRLPLHFLYGWKFDFERVKKYSFIYIRKPWFMDGDLIIALKTIKKLNPQVKILLEIPTYPYDNEGKRIDILPLLLKDKYWRRFLNRYVDRVVTYSNDDAIFNIDTIITSNAIDYDSCKRQNKLKDIGNRINMVACASLYYWHGYDRALKGLYNYYNGNHSRDIMLYIVGDGAEYNNYKKLIHEYSLEKYVRMTGSKYGSDLDVVYNKCIIGLDSMGRHRSGVKYNSSLKGKEYCAKGLIVVSGVETELDKDKNYKYYYRIPADDSPIDFNMVLEYVDGVCDNDSISSIQDRIMHYAETHFDFSVAMEPIRKFIETV